MCRKSQILATIVDVTRGRDEEVSGDGPCTGRSEPLIPSKQRVQYTFRERASDDYVSPPISNVLLCIFGRPMLVLVTGPRMAIN